jgi:tetratricopeptide (TPR) repeat protein
MRFRRILPDVKEEFPQMNKTRWLAGMYLFGAAIWAATASAQGTSAQSPNSNSTDSVVQAASDAALDQLNSDQGEVGELVTKGGRSSRKPGLVQSPADQPRQSVPQTQREPVSHSESPTKPPKTEVPVSATVIAPEDMERLKFADQYMNMARQSFEEAKRAPNPAAAQVAFRDGVLKAQQGQNLLRRVQATISRTSDDAGSVATAPATVQTPQTTQGPSRHGRLSFGTSGAAYQGQQINLSNISFDNPNLTGTTNAVKLDPNTPLMTTRQGTSVNVDVVIKTMQQLPNAPSGTKLFQEVPVPAPGSVPVPSRAVSAPPPTHVVKWDPKGIQALFDPRNQAEVKRIGGVSLEVTLDLLSYLGVSEFRQRGPVSVVELPVLLSLKRLHAAVRPYAKSVLDWNSLPEDLRYPGSVERIHGFVLDDKSQDLILVCSMARHPSRRLDLDCLILGLRTAWRDGVVPTVSLDPPSDRKAGPNYSRVEGIPIDTTFARIMLEADYAMKQIAFGLLDVGLPEIWQIRQKRADAGRTGVSRYWLSPVPVGPGQVHVSPTYRTLLFDSSVRCMTEAQSAPGKWSGQPDPDLERIAQLFTDAYDKLEESDRIQPAGIYVRLHALVDIVTTGKILRDMRIHSSALSDFVQLPVRQTTGAEATPRSFARIEVVVRRATKRIPWDYTVAGGAVLNSRVGHRSLDMYQDLTTLTLEHAADEFRAGSVFASRLDFPFALPRTVNSAGSRIDLLMMKGDRAEEDLDFETARDCFEQITRDDPYYAEGWTRLALARSTLGEHELARAAIRKAIDLEPDDMDLLLLEAYVLSQASEGNAKVVGHALAEKYDATAMRYLSTRITNIAWSNLEQGMDADDVRKLVDVALEAWPGNCAAWYVRSHSWKDPNSLNAIQDLRKGIDIARKAAQAEEADQVQFLPLMLCEDIVSRLVRVRLMDQSNVSAILDELDDIELAAEESRLFDDQLVLPIALIPQIKAIRAGLLLKRGETDDLVRAKEAVQEALKMADQAVKDFPQHPDPHLGRAVAMIMHGSILARQPLPDRKTLEQLTRGIRDELNRAIDLDSTFGSAYVWRAFFEAGFGNREKAMADVRILEKLAPNLGKQLQELIDRTYGANPVVAPKPPTAQTTAPEKKPAGDSPERRQTIALLDFVKKGLREYRDQRNRLPDAEIGDLGRELGPQGLGVVNFAKDQLNIKGQIIDGWKHPIVYQTKDGRFRVYSTGPDGIDDNGAGDDVELPDK